MFVIVKTHEKMCDCSVTVFTCLSCFCILIFFFRRLLPVLGRGELGGPARLKWGTAVVFVLFWFAYLAFSIYRVFESLAEKKP